MPVPLGTDARLHVSVEGSTGHLVIDGPLSLLGAFLTTMQAEGARSDADKGSPATPKCPAGRQEVAEHAIATK
jgi:hypothetical protein